MKWKKIKKGLVTILTLSMVLQNVAYASVNTDDSVKETQEETATDIAASDLDTEEVSNADILDAGVLEIPSKEELADNDYILYLANCGTSIPKSAPIGYKIGLFQSNVDQAYGEDAETGALWGYYQNSTTIRYSTTTYAGSNITDSKRFNYGYTTYDLNETGIYYNFQLPEGDYEVVLGFYNNWDTRPVHVALENTIVKQGLSLTKSNLVEVSYQTAVKDGELNVKVYNPNRTSSYADPLLSYVIVKTVVEYDNEFLTLALRNYKLSEDEREQYSIQSLGKYDEAFDFAETVANEEGTESAKILSVYNKLLKKYYGLKEKTEPIVYNSFSGTNGDVWLDTNGTEIQAHGGQVQQFTENGITKWYWYGEDKTDGYRTVDGGVRVYSSTDLYNWADEGVALRNLTDIYDFDEPYFSNLYEEYDDTARSKVLLGINDTTSVLERPKVIYNEKTDKYVMWFHADGPTETSNSNYAAASAGVAVSDSPTGPFRYIDRYRMHYEEGKYDSSKGMARDMNLFVDDDGTAYIIYASEENLTLFISKLNEDYTNIAVPQGQAVAGKDYLRIPCYAGSQREAPAIFKYKDQYYLMTSGCDGWAANAATYGVSDAILGTWKNVANPCVTDTSISKYPASITFGTQSTNIIPVDAESGKFIYMGDRWNNVTPTANELVDPKYVWLPVEFGVNGEMIIKPYVDWSLDILDTMGDFEVITELPKFMQKGDLSSLPETLQVKFGTSEFTSRVTWTVLSGDSNVIGTTVTVKGTLLDTSGRTMTADVLIISEGLVYFVDCGTTQVAGLVPEAYNAVKEQVSLKNRISDQMYNETDGWGYTSYTSLKGKTADVSSTIYATGYYGANTKSTAAATYKLKLEPGEYEIVSSHYDWWNHDNVTRTTVSKVTYNNGSATVDQEIGSCSTTGIHQLKTISGKFSIAQEQVVTVTFSSGSTSTQGGVVAFFTIEKFSDKTNELNRSNLFTVIDDAEKIDTTIYTLETESSLLAAIATGKEAYEFALTQIELDAAAALITNAVASLQLADKSTLAAYVTEDLTNGKYSQNDALQEYKNLLASEEIQSVYNKEKPTRAEISAAIALIVAARAKLTLLIKELIINGNTANLNPADTFKGFGTVSCNNSSRLLLDYKEEHPDEYWEIMNLLFNPETGAGINHVKVEMGADGNTSSGTEPSTKRSADEPANVNRGAGWHFAADAKSINPNVKVSFLRWAEPGWVKNAWVNDKTNTGYKLMYQWYKETIDAVYDEFGMKVDYVSPDRNETSSPDAGWIKYFAKTLKAETNERYDYDTIKIVASDENTTKNIATAMKNDEELRNLVDVIAYHYTVFGTADITLMNETYGKEVWYSEGVASIGDSEYRANAGLGVGGANSILDVSNRVINSYYLSSRTHYMYQPAVASFYEGSKYNPKQLIGAFDPWSGYYLQDVGLQMTMHFTQFAKDGWLYVDSGCFGDGSESSNSITGSTTTNNYMTLTDPEKTDYSTIITNDSDSDREYEIIVTNIKNAGEPVKIWETRGPDAGEATDANWYQHIGDIHPVLNPEGSYSYRVVVKAYSMITLTTTEGQTEYTPGRISKSERTVLALPYTDDFEYSEYRSDYLRDRGNTPRYTTDQGGAFEVLPGENNVLQQVIIESTRPRDWGYTPVPHTVLGDDRWANYQVSIDFKLDTATVQTSGTGNYAGLGARHLISPGTDNESGYSVKVYQNGSYQLLKVSTVVASGTVANFNSSIWHSLVLECKETEITAYLDGQQFVTYTDSSNASMTGRVSILSGYYQTQFDNLKVDKIFGYVPYATERVDNLAHGVEYTGSWTHTATSGYDHHNRSLSSAGTGITVPHTSTTTVQGTLNRFYLYREGSTWGANTTNAWATGTSSYLELAFEGKGVSVYGEANSSNGTGTVYLDGVKVGTANYRATSSAETCVYTVTGLVDGKHTVKIVADSNSAYISLTKAIIEAENSAGKVSYRFNGTGFNIVGASSAAVIDVYVDGELVGVHVPTVATNRRETSYRYRGLEDGPHTLTIEVISGTYTIDAFDIYGAVYGERPDPEIDLTALESSLADAKELLNNEIYTLASRNALSQMILEIEDEMAGYTTQSEVTSAILSLAAAVANLELAPVDLEDMSLAQLIEIALEELAKADVYTASTLEALEDAIVAAQAILGSPYPIIVENARQDLIAAIKMLELLPTSGNTALDELKELFAKARLLADTEGTHTQSSRQNLTDFLDEYEPYLDDSISDYVIEEITKAINELIDALVVESEPIVIDKTALLRVISDAEELSSDDYTSESWESMQTILREAKAIYAGEINDQELIDTVAEILQEEINALVDLRELKTAIAREIGLVSSNYTLASWYTALILLYDAKAVLAKSNATAEEVTAVADALNTAYDHLVVKVNKNNLKAAIDSVATYDTAFYTTLSVLKMKLALNDAQKVYNGAGYSQSEVDAAELALKNAIAALVSQVNKTQLKAQITSASAIPSSNYTFVSWYNLRLAISAATSVANDVNATQAQVDEQVTLLKAAEAALISK